MTLKNAIPKADIDEVNAFIDNLMETDIPNPDITFLGYTLDPAKGGAAPYRTAIWYGCLQNCGKQMRVCPHGEFMSCATSVLPLSVLSKTNASRKSRD